MTLVGTVLPADDFVSSRQMVAGVGPMVGNPVSIDEVDPGAAQTVKVDSHRIFDFAVAEP